jgi:hypothetical protein
MAVSLLPACRCHYSGYAGRFGGDDTEPALNKDVGCERSLGAVPLLRLLSRCRMYLPLSLVFRPLPSQGCLPLQLIGQNHKVDLC